MNLFNTIASLMFPVIVGFAFRRAKGFSDKDASTLRRFAVSVTTPQLIFTSMYTADIGALRQAFPISAAFILFVLLMSLAGLGIAWAAKLEPRRRRAFIISIGFGNHAWVGWALAYTFLGEAGFSRSVLFTMMYWPMFFLVSSVVCIGASGLRKQGVQILRKVGPAVLSRFAIMGLGITLNLVGFELPQALTNTLHSFGEMTVTLMLFTIGLQLDLNRAKQFTSAALGVSAARVAAGILIAIVVTSIVPLDPISRKMVLLQGIVPTAVTVTLLLEYFDLEQDVLVGSVVISTILSFLVIPLAAPLLVM